MNNLRTLYIGMCVLVPVWASACQATGHSLPVAESIDLSRAQAQINIDGRDYRLQADMWQNRIPRVEDGVLQRPMVVLIRVSAVDENPIPDDIHADSIWLIQGDNLWQGAFSDEVRLKDPARRHQYERIARKGPLWKPGSSVDVIVRVLDGKGRYYLLRVNHQQIKKAY
ncbi:MAG TPA: hypothetical protein ENI80_00645 [Acidiferrobacteraceae bacterium]|nr:hypothetical protein [Acidiferrobacteraceae bacterium]